MIKFRQKEFSEYDAMRSLYVELNKNPEFRNRVSIIDSSSLIPILKGNCVVIERFVISTSLFNNDKYRMYLKIGAKAKMPDKVRLPGNTFERRVGNLSVKFNNGIQFPKQQPNQNNYSDNGKKKKGNGGDGGKYITSQFQPNINLSYETTELIGRTLKYDISERSLVLEFDSLYNAIKSLNILPFGIGYKIYLLS